MASAISHAVVAAALGSAAPSRALRPRFWLLGIACAVLPDIDVLGFRVGIQYGDMLGHRGLTHSLTFAAVLSILVVAAAFRDARWKGNRQWLWLYFFAATASHGVLDAMTNGGLGVAFFAPFDTTRYFLPLRPIEVSPLSIPAFFTARGIAVLWSELRWIWLPSLGFAMLAFTVRHWVERPIRQPTS